VNINKLQTITKQARFRKVFVGRMRFDNSLAGGDNQGRFAHGYKIEKSNI
jgi:hypothetical protein